MCKTAFLIEGLGAAVLALRFCPTFDPWRGLWYAVLHSVSAFCNAGFDLMGSRAPFSSLTGYVGDPAVNLTVMALIVVGGLTMVYAVTAGNGASISQFPQEPVTVG